MSFYEYGKTEEYLLSLIKGGAEPRLEELRKEAEDAGVPVLCETGAQLLKLITVMTAPTRILEIGTAAGYSGLVMLLNSGAKLYTIDFDGEVLEKARENFARFGMSHRTEIFEGDASDIVPMVEGKFDLIFLDGPKGRYYEFLPYLTELLPKGGILLCDNVLYSERMSGAREVPKSKQTIADRLALFIKKVTTDKRLLTSVLPVGDGMSLSVRV